MRMSKGYSLVEMMVAAGVMAIFVSMMLPFFMFQTSQQTESSRTKYADQECDLALTFMRRDIMHAGLGCRGNSELAIYVKDGAGDDPDELFLNYAGYLNLKGPAGLDRISKCGTSAGNQAALLILNSVFNSQGSIDYNCSPWQHLRYQGAMDYDQNFPSWPGDRFALYGIPANISKHIIGAVIGRTRGTDAVDTVMDVNLYDTAWPASGPSPIPDTLQHVEFFVESIDWSPGKSLQGRVFAPAISYKVADEGLWRNPGPDNSRWGRPLAGDLPNMGVTDMQIRCQFVDDAGVVQWSPDDGAFGTPGMEIQNLRLLEITLTYRTKLSSDYGTKWTADRSRRISVSPRTVVMLHQ